MNLVYVLNIYVKLILVSVLKEKHNVTSISLTVDTKAYISCLPLLKYK